MNYLCRLILLLLVVFVVGGLPVAAQDVLPPRLIGAGDIAVCSDVGDEATANLVESLLDPTRDLVFTAGDNVYQKGTLEEFQTCYHPSWGRFKRYTRPVLGNHEYGTRGAEGYFTYFGEKIARPEGYSFYSFTHGEWLILMLNSNIDARKDVSIQGKWLRETLEKNPRRCTMAIWHHPLLASVGGTYSDRPRDIPALWEVLYDYGVDVIVNGHVHNYERFAPLDPMGTLDRARGIRQFIVGTGGASRSRNILNKRKPYSEAYDKTSLGVIVFTLYADRYVWEFVPAAGFTYRDQGSARCVD
ncbi:MAG TPA: metallophosphoesterase [Aggregatilineales bacterium]|nr:metallophosphoesterase [Anaerolineales bacterium]HRE48939.1 metallophosphoesterase [Aggregatilineales bacterium]